ncbi:hypothetical protein BBBGCB_BBBGCB_06370, partial [Dysosmobacter welbionis]
AALDILADAAAHRHDVVRADQVHQLLGGLHDLHNLGVQVALAQLEAGLHDLARIRLGLVEDVLLHHAGAHRRHAGTEPRADDGGHQVAAESRTGHLQVPVLHIPLLAVHVQGAGLTQELDVVRHIHVQVGAVGAQAGMQTGRTAGTKVTADVGGADQERLGLQILDHVADDLGIGIGVVDGQQGALAHQHLVGAVAAQLLGGGLDALAAQQQAAQVHAQLVGQVAALGDQLKVGGHQFALALLAEDPHILESSDISAIEIGHCSNTPFSDDVLGGQNGSQLLAGLFAGTLQHLAGALLGRGEALEDVGGRALQADGGGVDQGMILQLLIVKGLQRLVVGGIDAVDAHIAGLVQLLDAGKQAGSLDLDGHVAVL